MTEPDNGPTGAKRLSDIRQASERAVAAGAGYRHAIVTLAAVIAAAVIAAAVASVIVVFRVGGVAHTNQATLNLLLNQQAQSGKALQSFTDREDAVAAANTIARRRDLRALCAFLNGGPCVGLHFPKPPPPPPPIVIAPAPTSKPRPGSPSASSSGSPRPHPRPNPSPSPTARSPTPRPTSHPTPRPTVTPSPTRPPLVCVTIRNHRICTPTAATVGGMMKGLTMARVPFARWDPVDFHDDLEHRDGKATVACLHTNDGGADLTPWFNSLHRQTGDRLGCTFQVLKDGTIVQLADTSRIIYAEFSLSARACSIEHEDDGDPSRPLTAAQIAADVRLLRWLHEHEAVPLHLMDHADGNGVTWHERFDVYNEHRHNCPGHVREQQIIHTIVPRASGQRPHRPTHPHPGHVHVPAPRHDLPLPWMVKSSDTARWQRQMIARGWTVVPGTRREFRADGVFGHDSQAVATAFERQITRQGFHPEVDGRVGPVSWRAAWTAPITR